jgi:UDP-N-acetylglucosamine diphosphorylase / glucose-1-phosphate thymidylyltransferase / UDP-N-acetylgalactosamine diphosphorylase / glucosamine-1-phosphate N-acetyltransferase / galactosamine-1-phosphate N-acetyltransferase
MKILIFEDNFYQNLFPLSILRPVYDIVMGALTIKERLEINANKKYEVSLHCRNLLAPLVKKENKRTKVNTIEKDDYLFVNGRVSLPYKYLEELIKKLKPGEAVKSGDIIIAAKVSKDNILYFKDIIENKDGENILSLENFKDFKFVSFDEKNLIIYNFPWNILDRMDKELYFDLEYFASIRRNRKKKQDDITIIDKENVIISNVADIFPYSVFDGTHGAIVIEAGALIEPFVYLKGPVYIGSRCVVKAGTKINGPAYIGDGSKVSGEISECIFQRNVNKQHDGFVGNTYACPFVNFGADTVTSNLKNNYSKVKVKFNGQLINTGMQFLGSVVGDHTKFGINTMLNTGTIAGIFANVAGGGFPDKAIDSFSWNILGGESSKYKIDEAISTARIVMERRHMEMTKEYEELLRKIYKFL